MTSTTPNATPTGELAVVPALGERVAADLRTLADLAERHPNVAVELARTVEQLYIVVTNASPLHHHEVGDPLIEAGAHRVTPTMNDDPWWETQAWQLPAGVIRLVVTRLAVPVDGDTTAELNASAS